MADGTGNRVILGDIWEEAIAFARREIALLTPIALAFFGLPALLALAAGGWSDANTPAGMTRVVIVAAAALLINMYGNLAVAALVLRPGGSVRDALVRAADRYMTAFGAVLIAAAALLAYVVVLSIVLAMLVMAGVLAQPGTARLDGTTAVLLPLVALPLVVLMVRLATLCALVAGTDFGSRAALVAAMQQTRPVFWRLLLLSIVYGVVTQLIVAAINLGFGSVARLGGLAAGAPIVADLVVAVVVAGVTAATSGFWAVLMARLYQRLAPRSLSALFE